MPSFRVILIIVAILGFAAGLNAYLNHSDRQEAVADCNKIPDPVEKTECFSQQTSAPRSPQAEKVPPAGQ